MNFRIIQLLAGRDFAISSWSPISSLIFNFARMLQNFIYIIACEQTKECVIVDVCWDVDSVLKVIEDQGYTLKAAIVTHYHFDHVGGKPPKPYDSYRVKVDGLAKVLRKYPHIRAYIHSADITGVNEANDIPLDRVEPTYDNYELNVGQSINIKFIHTPGHTPGSQCLLINDKRLLSGDTLFIGNVGRLDFPDSNVEKMYESLQKLKALDDDIMVYAGHDYGGAFTSIADEKRTNPVLKARTLSEFTMAATG